MSTVSAALTLPDALCESLRAKLLAQRPAEFTDTTAWPESRFRVLGEDTPLPCPRILFAAGEPVFQRMMIGTARIPIEVVLATSLDRTAPADHRALAAALDAWLRSVAAAPGAVYSVHLHVLDVLFPLTQVDSESGEQVTRCRGSAMATLLV